VLGDRLAEFFTDVDHSNHEALVAVPTEESRTIVGRVLGERPRHEGIRRFTLHLLADNAAVLALVRSAGGESSEAGTGVVSAQIDLGLRPSGLHLGGCKARPSRQVR